MAIPLNDKNFSITDGLGGELLITDGYGASSTAVVDDSPGPGAFIPDHVERGKALFVTQFRQLRDDL